MPDPIAKDSYYFGDFRLDRLAGPVNVTRRLFRVRSTIPVNGIGQKSLELLEYFLQNPKTELEREALYQAVWKGEKGDWVTTVDAHLKLIRAALDDKPEDPKYIRNIRGHGFEFLQDVIPPKSTASPGDAIAAKLSPQDAQAFEEFFGAGAAEAGSSSARGVIVVQADQIDKLVEAINVNAHAEIKKTPGNRSYKARTWANFNDLLGAQAIVRLFDSHRLRPPQIVLSLHNSREDLNIPSDTTFIAAMGLGFTDRSARAFKLCHAWMRVSRTTEAGDAVALHEKLMLRICRREDAKQNALIPAADVPGFWARVPRGWDSAYLDSWLAWHKVDNAEPTVQDYAIILRHTQEVGHRKQVLFVLAGFTELGTAVAGRYLAGHWRGLWKKYVHGQPHDGDFLALIEGPSDPGQFGVWEENEGFAITPQAVFDAGIHGCPWFDRVAARVAPRSPVR